MQVIKRLFFLSKLILAPEEDSRFSHSSLNQEVLKETVTHVMTRKHRDRLRKWAEQTKTAQLGSQPKSCHRTNCADTAATTARH